MVVTAAIVMSLFEGIAAAQVPGSTAVARPGSTDFSEVAPPVDLARDADHRSLQPIRDSFSRIDFGPVTRQSGTGSVQAPSGRNRSTGRKVLGAAIGATAGFFAGGYLGAAIEGDSCHCDDPGLKGALIGAPVGAVTGGILGALFF